MEADCDGGTLVVGGWVWWFGDLTYEISREYIGKDSTVFTSKGSFEWDETGNRIRMKTPESDLFQVGENRLFMLDSEGNRIQGALEAFYVLQKD